MYCNNKGQVESVRYEMVNAMLLNEFLKEHRKVQEQETTNRGVNERHGNVLARLREHDSKVQQVSEQIDLNEATPRLTANEQR